MHINVAEEVWQGVEVVYSKVTSLYSYITLHLNRRCSTTYYRLKQAMPLLRMPTVEEHLKS
jgi:hypothetical protein